MGKSTSLLQQQQKTKNQKQLFLAKDDDMEITDEKLQRWKEIRFLSDEEAEATMAGEELEGYKAHHQRVKDDIEKAIELAKMMCDAIESTGVKPKTKGQKRRDKWASVQEREAAKAASTM